MLSILIRPKILSFRNSVNAGVLLRRLPFIAIGIGFWILFYIGTYRVLAYVRGIEFFGEILSRKIFSMTFFSLMGFLVLSNIITAISSFYLSKDIPFLLSKPVEIRHVIRLKALETVLNSSWMVISFIPPVFIAYGISYHASASYYIFISVAFTLFIFLTAGLGISTAHLLARIFPAHRTRNALLGVGIILFLLLYLVLKSVIPHNLNTPEDFIKSITAFKTDSPFLPAYWITEAVSPLLENKGFDIFYFLVLLSNTAFFLLVSSIIGMRFYRGNIERIQPSGRGLNRGLLSGFYPGHGRAVFYKDTKIFFRDTGQWSQIFIIGALVMVYIYNFMSIPVDSMSGISVFIKELMVLINMVMAGLVLAAVAARFLYASVSLEGQAFWIIRTTPIDIGRFLWSKFVYGCAPITILIIFLVVLTNLAMNVKGLLMIISSMTTLMLCISVSGLGTGFGAIYPKFRYENIASVSMSLGGMAFMLIAFSVVLITLSLEAWMFYIYHQSAAIDASPGLTWKIQIAACIGVILSLNVAAFYLPMRMGIKKLEGMSVM